MTTEQRRYFVQSVIGSAVVNAILNGAIGWVMMRGQSELAVWKIPGVAADLIATAFGVAFGTCVGANIQVRFDVSRGKIDTPSPLPFAALITRFPSPLLKRAVVLGVLSVPIFLPPLLFGLAASGQASLASASFIALKAVFSALEGALVTPFILLAALDGSARSRGRV